MKPRQTVKNYPNPNVPPYQQPNSSNLPMLGDIDLTKLGLNLDDMSNLTNQEDIVKCLQSIYSKSSAELLQKMPQLNDWPMQSVSPSNYSGLGSSSNANKNNGASSSNSGVGDGNNVNVGTCGLGFNNNINNNNNNNNNNSNNNINNNLGGQQKQDLQFTNSQHSQPSSAINHFRIPTSSVHSPQQPLSQQQKSVLSLHQQHQNDLSNRRLNHHHMSTTNTSFANLSTVNASNATSTSTPASDTNNLTALGSNIISNKNPCSSGLTPHSVANIMDTLGSMDNMFFDGSLQVSKDAPTNQQSLIRHQQLQKLLKATGSQLKPSSSLSSSSTTLLHRNDLQSQRNISSASMPQSPHQISSPATTMPPQQAAFSSVPKSLLNLAACSSSSPTSTSTPTLPCPPKFSSMVSQLNLRSRNASGQTNLISSGINSNNGSTTSSRSLARINSGNAQSTMTGSSNNNIDAFIAKSSNYGSDHSNMLQQLVRSAASAPNQANLGPSTRSSAKSIPLSLLSDDQSSANRTNLRSSSNVQPGPNCKTPSHTLTPALNIRDMYKDIVANFQKTCDREIRAGGTSVGEAIKPVQTSNLQSVNDSVSSNITNQYPQHGTTISMSPTQSKGEFMKSVDNKEIESALSRVEARNDLSLLYPPLMLATNSQKQINALSAGLQGTEESEMFTKEVKRIVLEECNIIYECKECNNLFRSLANLVKHKRTYCLENASEQSVIEMNRRSIVNSILPMDQPTISITSSPATIAGDSNQEVVLEDNSTIEEPGLIANNCNLKGTDRRQNLANDLRMLRIIRNQEREVSRKAGQVNGANLGTPATQTSLSKLLQSQPKNRLPASRDSALIGALNMSPISTTILSATNPLSAFEVAKNMNCSSSDVHEQLVRNSSLAKTLLNEKVKSVNPRQSLIELSKAESIQPSTTKRVAPKRKFLEDCIQKVKRDKLFNDEDETQIQITPIASNFNAAIVKTTNLQKVGRETINSELGDSDLLNSPGDSDNDSDMLTIDLDGPKKGTPLKKAKPQIDPIASSSESSSSLTRLNTSSALLKALTRPIDSKRPYNASLISFDRQDNIQDISREQVLAEENAEIEVLSPLFDKHSCDICDTDFVDLATLMNHTIDRHREEKMLYPCIFCSFSFIALENVCRHIIDIHKKPKTQVHRLKEVVRSRSYISSDFLACSDYSSKIVEEKDLKPKDITYDEPIDIDHQSKSCSSLKNEGMRTRGKKRVDYNQMVNSDAMDDSDAFPSRTRKSRSKSADQTTSQTEKTQDDLNEKAASVGVNPIESDCEVTQDISPGQDVIPSQKVLIQQLNVDDKLQRGEVNSEKSTESNEVVEIVDTENNMKLNIDEPSNRPDETADLCEENEAINEEFASTPGGYNEDGDAGDEDGPEDDESEGAGDAEEEDEIEQTEQCESDGSDASSDSSSSSGSDSGSSSTSSTSTSSSSSSTSGSSSSSSSSSSSGSDAKDSSQKDSGPQQNEVVDDGLEQSSGQDSKLHENIKPTSSGKQFLSAKESKSQQSGHNQKISPYLGNDSDSELCEASEDGGEDYDSTPPNEPDKREQTPESVRQNAQRPPSSSKSTSESTPSSNSAGGGGGGIMKLKIQLKTRPDEKSKVYEIV